MLHKQKKLRVLRALTNTPAAMPTDLRRMPVISLSIVIAAVIFTSGCASIHANNPDDPLETFNRGIYLFNDGVDKAVIKPVAQVYDTAVPELGKTVISNFFSNLDDVIVTANDFLQLKFEQGILDGTRFMVNSTFGIYGLVDIGSHIGLEKHNEDFGQTMGKWGVGSGPYIVLPILGASTLRDSAGLYADSQQSKLRRIEHIPTRNQMYVAKAISQRAKLLKQEKILEEAAIDRYEFIRDSYLQRRDNLVYDGNPPRRKYDDDDLDVSNRHAPGSDWHASRTNDALLAPRPEDSLRLPQAESSLVDTSPAPMSSEGMALSLPALATPQVAAYPPGTYKIWGAQRTGIR